MPSSSGALKPSRSGSTQKMAANIKVVVRVRPSNSKESVANSRNVVDVVDDKMLVFDPKEEQLPFFYQGQQQPSRGFLKRPNKELKFVFDNVFNQYASNRDIFEVTTKEILASLMEGYNCSVFVYGATGAGKTFTMIGSQESPGITYLTMEHLFYSINSQEKDREFEIGVSYLEVYNENVYDLLKTHKVPLQLREDAKYGVMVAGLTLQTIKTAQELLNMLENGNKNRTQHPTDANAESSRSHAVFQVYITMRYKISSEVRMVKLSMIDLAGSERASATGCHGDRFKEGANINRSLLSLGNCINKLADGSNYIPYRDSKLTRLLKDSLGGNCKTVMIANVSPSSLSFEDTYNTLKYAARANKIQLSIKKNIVDGDVRSSQYVKLNEELKKKLKELEAKLALSSVPVAPVNDKAKKEWRRRLEDCESTHADCQNRVLNLMVRQRVLAMRHRLRTRAFSHVTDLVHRSSYEAMDQVYTEEVPRHERVVENYHRQAVSLDSKITNAWKKWQTSNKNLKNLCQKALQELPDLADFIKVIELQSELRQSQARDNLRQKLVAIENKEINAFADYVSEMPALLKKLYFTLKGYDKAPPALTEEYLEIMRKAKHATGITWSDDSEDTDPHFDFITNLDLNNLNSIPEFKCKKEVNSDLTDSEDLTDQENQLSDKENQLPVLSPLKRKGTPIKLPNNETIIIDDSFEALDTTKTLSNKKVKKEFPLDGVENASVLNANDLNSTFVLAGKIDGLNKKVKDEFVYPVKRGLFDRPNNIQRPVPDKSKILKPIIGKAAAFRRPLTAPPVASSKSGFGSSLSRDGTPLQRNVQADQQRRNINERSVGFKAVRGRERVQNHPYTRPAARR